MGIKGGEREIEVVEFKAWRRGNDIADFLFHLRVNYHYNYHYDYHYDYDKDKAGQGKTAVTFLDRKR